MPKVLKRNAIIVLGLAVLFYWSFMFAKHDPALRNVIPFGDDPYDAVGSFGVIIAMLVALLSFFRAFRPYREPPSTAQRVYLVRSQEAVVLAVFITLATDAVAMARHASMWMEAASRDRLIALLGGVAIVTAAVQLLIRAAQQKLGEFGTTRWAVPASVTLLALLVLASYPEHLINPTATHLLTVVAADAIVLCVPMRALLNAFVPYASGGERMEKLPARGRFLTAGQRWAIALLAGVLIGAFAFLGEMGEGSSALPWGRVVFIASVYITLGLVGILIAYASLGELLGLKPRG
ncbi:MAG TPA: hypothetical protein VE195_08620 [Acidobacteriaceae bacterium]|nr:hypothetical protein [Acidobacteriaceae bacterium]